MTSNTSYLLDSWYDGTTVYFQVNNGTVYSTTLTLPAAATNLGLKAYGYEDGAAVTVSFGRFYLEGN